MGDGLMLKSFPLMPPINGQGRARGIAIVVLCAIAQAICAGIAAFATRDVFVALREEDVMPTLDLVLLSLSGFGLAGARIGERVAAERVGQDYAAQLRKILFNHLSKVPAPIIEQKRKGGLALRFVGDLSAIRGWVALGLTRLISAMIVLPIACLVLFLLDPRLGLAAIGPLAVGIVVMAVLGSRMAPQFRKVRSYRSKLASDMSERVPVAPELRLLGRMGAENANLEKRNNKFVEAAVRRTASVASLRGVSDVAAALAGAALLYAAVTHSISAPIVAGALSALGLMVRPMRSLAGVWNKRASWVAACEKCERVLALPVQQVRAPSLSKSSGGKLAALPSTSTAPKLEFNHVSYRGFSDLNLTIEAGKKVALLGPNGAGKSAILMLASGLDHPESGEVKVAGDAVSQLPHKERSQLIGYFGGASPILAGSVRRAMTLGVSPRPSDKRILGLAQEYGFGPTLDRLGGLMGKVAEGGRNLSSGEVRRLHLVRLALGNSPCLLLDEADDALDRESRQQLLNLIMQPGRTCLVSTHDISLAREMDEVCIIREGQLVTRGEPDLVLASELSCANAGQTRNAA